jgi:hypothetical protein
MTSGLLWVTYGKDLEWFCFSARSYRKFARGWQAAKCVVPNCDLEAFKPICDENGILLCGFDEWPGKGQLHHQAMKCYGDLHFPKADVIFHIDADTVFAKPCCPEDWFIGDKILLAFRDFSTLLKKPLYPGEEMDFQGCHGLKVDFQRGAYFWKFATDVALGWPAQRECMQCLPIAHHRAVYDTARKCVAAQHDTDFESYVRNCRNEFPQTFCEFNTLGAVAQRFYGERYIWHDVHNHGHNRWGYLIQSHSHSGFDAPHDNAVNVGPESPKQLFTRLGLT